MTESRILTGGCACRQLTFETRGEPKRVGLCHCMTCRKESGGPFNAFAIFPVDQVTISGEMRGWSASPDRERCFCPICGSQVFYKGDGNEIEVKLGAFDETNLFTPTYETWTKRREGWLRTTDLQSFPENRGEVS
jgi:hypothetical protein